jgi:membrane protease YdiL (CAAX protease family)
LAAAVPPNWRSASRAIAFAVLAVSVLVMLARYSAVSGGARDQTRWAGLYRRAGDTYTAMYCLARAAGSEESAIRMFLLEAYGYYLSAAEADPSDVRSATSAAAVLQELGRTKESRASLYRAARQDLSPAEQAAVSALVALSDGRDIERSQLASARSYLVELVAGRLALARAYEAMGQEELARREREAAADRGRALVPALWAMFAVTGIITLCGLIGLGVWLRGLAKLRRAPRPAPPAEARAASPGWGLREAVEALIIWLVAAAVMGAALTLALGADRRREPFVILLPTIAAGVAAIGWVWIMSGRRARLGWAWRRPWAQIAAGVAAAGICALPTLALYKVLQELFGQGPMQHPLMPVFFSAKGWMSKAMLVVSACTLVPALEETLFRGVLYRALRARWSAAPAAAGSAAIFALGHLSLAGLLPYWLLGVVFAYLYERSGSLLVPTAAHGAFNGFNLALLLVLVG